MNINKINAELGWQPRYNLEDGLRNTVEWYLDNSAWLDAIIKEKDFQKWVKVNYQRRGQA
jgi:dTDP-glucose 4,6-dehydratase